jgi:hypothetical protein
MNMTKIIYIEIDEKAISIAKKVLAEKSKSLKLAIPKKAAAFDPAVLANLQKKLSQLFPMTIMD